MKKFTFRKSVALTAAAYVVAIAGVLLIADSCNKGKRNCDGNMHNGSTPTATTGKTPASYASSASIKKPLQTGVVTVANIRRSADGSSSQVMFLELAEMFSVSDATLLASLQDALANNRQIQITFDPWRGTVLEVSPVNMSQSAISGTKISADPGGIVFDLSHSATVSDDPAALGILNTTSPSTGLTDVIPDFATAQLMFDYITHQSCSMGGPFAIDYCISFQYCEDGCYARAHKMCWVLNNKYHYATHKIFSFANAGSDQLSVKGEKWGGCCINWWYHVAPLVNVKTPTGTKSYVFDAAMFDQPVLLSTWLHAQANPACVSGSTVAHVSMINIQPTTSYEPASYSGYAFNTDPMYANTDTTLVHYSPLVTCP